MGKVGRVQLFRGSSEANSSRYWKSTLIHSLVLPTKSPWAPGLSSGLGRNQPQRRGAWSWETHSAQSLQEKSVPQIQSSAMHLFLHGCPQASHSLQELSVHSWTKAFGWLRGHKKTLVQQVGWIDSRGVLGFHSPEQAGRWGGRGACISRG